MLQKTKTDLILGLLIVVASLIVLFVWIPNDVETGIFEKVRRSLQIGDSFAPTIAASILAIGGVLLIIESIQNPGYTRLGLHSWIYAIILFAGFAITMAIMRWAGPITASLFGPQEAEYRILRDTAPWKYVGFVLGGTFLITALIAAIEHRLTWQIVAIGFAATLLLIGIYDLPFDDLLLPPNGDV